MRYTLLLLSFLAGIIPAVAQQQTHSVITDADYTRAERFLSANTTPLISGVITRPTWLPDGRLSYRNSIPEGSEFVLADPVKQSRKRAFDHVRLARALSTVADTTYEPFRLPFTQFDFSEDGAQKRGYPHRDRRSPHYHCGWRTEALRGFEVVEFSQC